MSVYDRMKDRDVTLPEPPRAGAVYAPVKQTGDLLFVSGQGPFVNGVARYLGKAGAECSLEDAHDAARLCILNTLALVEQHVGDLDLVKNVVKVLGFVASAPGFNQQPEVVNGASQLLVDLFGDKGWHSRSAVGTNELPRNITVEIESIFEV